jgi:hypothetical protein
MRCATGGSTRVRNSPPHISRSTTFGDCDAPRTLAIGADGLAYIAVSSPFNGAIAVDPDPGTVVNTLPTIGTASGQVITNVIADTRGSIYWGAGTHLMHDPSSIP